MKSKRVLFIIGICALLLCTFCGSAFAAGADKFPQRSIKVIVPFAAGGGGDLSARALLKFVDFGQPAVVVNIPGAGSVIGTMEAFNSPADGYTLLSNTPAGMIIGKINELYEPDVAREMIPLVVMGVDNPVFCVGKDSPLKTAQAFFDYARTNPGKLRLGANGMTTMYTSALIIQDVAGIEVNYVSFDSGTKSRAALLGGHVETLLAPIGENRSLIEAGDIVPLFVLSEERSPFLPDVPTMIELGYDAIGCLGTRGFWAPAGTPEEIVQKLEAALVKGMQNPEFKKVYLDMGIEPVEWDRVTTQKWIEANSIYYKELIEKYGKK